MKSQRIAKNHMPPKKSITLTEAELRLMKLLWKRGESVVSDLVAAMPEGEALAYNSVYRACVAEQEASRSEVRHVLSRFFGNSHERLLLSLLGDEEISPAELQRLKNVIRAAEDSSLQVEEGA